jgi:hypothetical protein
MRALVFFMFAALAFSLLAGGIEALWDRRDQRRLAEKTSTLLHPFARHPFRSIRYPLSLRVLHLVGLFFGFLLATYVGMHLL